MLKSLPRDALMTQSSPVISGKHHLDTESGLRYEDHMYEFVFSYLALQKKSPLCRDLDPFGSIRSMLVASAQVATGSFYSHVICQMIACECCRHAYGKHSIRIFPRLQKHLGRQRRGNQAIDTGLSSLWCLHERPQSIATTVCRRRAEAKDRCLRGVSAT